jgi:hypothetical protein
LNLVRLARDAAPPLPLHAAFAAPGAMLPG